MTWLEKIREEMKNAPLDRKLNCHRIRTGRMLKWIKMLDAAIEMDRRAVKILSDCINGRWPTYGDFRNVLAALTSDPTGEVIVLEPDKRKLEMIRGAVARGWCHIKNERKEMDVDLAEAISQEVALVI